MEHKVESIDYTELRQRIAGLLDQETPLDISADNEMRDLAANLVCLMAQVFGDELDRKTLYSRIDSGLRTACAKVTDGNMDLFLNHCLEHVKADPARTCATEDLGKLLATLTEKPLEWRTAFTRFINTRIYAVLVHGREQWSWKKLEKRVEKGTI